MQLLETKKRLMADAGPAEDVVVDMMNIFSASIHHKVAMEKVWCQLKDIEDKMMKPLISHAKKLNRIASPSTKQCLQIYKRPTACDTLTGKPIPLGHILKRKQPRSIMSIINSALSKDVRHTQAKAEIMMKRSDPYNSMAKDIHTDWYFTSTPTLSLTPRSKGENTAPPQLPTTAPLSVKREERMPPPRKQLARYLFKSNRLLSALLEVDEEESPPQSRSIFLTESKQSLIESPSKTSNDCKRSVEASWQPLTTAALLEHTRVIEISPRGQPHGHYSMWRPPISYVS